MRPALGSRCAKCVAAVTYSVLHEPSPKRLRAEVVSRGPEQTDRTSHCSTYTKECIVNGK